jgi:erythromycin esterase-like protein
MAENLRWILGRLEPEARILVFGANGHIAAAPQRIAIDPGVDAVTLGMYVKQELPGEVLTIGHSAVNGSSGNCGRMPRMRLSSPPSASLDAHLASIGTPLFVLDLREAPDGVSRWLDVFQEHNNGFGSVWYQYSRAMDLIFFSGPVSPACPG